MTTTAAVERALATFGLVKRPSTTAAVLIAAAVILGVVLYGVLTLPSIVHDAGRFEAEIVVSNVIGVVLTVGVTAPLTLTLVVLTCVVDHRGPLPLMVVGVGLILHLWLIVQMVPVVMSDSSTAGLGVGFMLFGDAFLLIAVGCVAFPLSLLSRHLKGRHNTPASAP